MARRGDSLREHILDKAKEAFLETGFERTSMDALAQRAQTSKRSLYAHFPTKEALFVAVIDHIDELFQGKLLSPEQYASDPTEAVSLYCARFLQMLGWESVVQTCRLCIDAAGQFPEASQRLYDVFFKATSSRLGSYVSEAYHLAALEGKAIADDLLGATMYPQLPELLLGARQPTKALPNPERLAHDADVPSIRRAVAARLADVAQ